MICIYHSRDLDGFTSAIVVKKRFPEAKLIGFDYGQELPMDDIPAGEPIVMIDVSIPVKEMELLAARSGHFTWIDHHVSAIDEFENFTKDKETAIFAVTKVGVAACEIAWEHFFPAHHMPTAIKLLGEYDTWRNSDKFRWDNAIMPFQYGMRQICNSPDTFPIDVLRMDFEKETDSPVYGIINTGKAILDFMKTQNELACKRGAFDANFMGYRCICLCGIGINSNTFDSVYKEEKHDIMMPFFFDGKKWVISIYTTKEDVDCSVIAKANGGGGHKKAAGFQSDDMSFFSHSHQGATDERSVATTAESEKKS